jgi:hypothetical protein
MVCRARCGSRGSARHRAKRSAIPRRRSISARTRTPASEVRRPPSKAARTGLAATGDKPGRTGASFAMTGATSVDRGDPASAPGSYPASAAQAAPAARAIKPDRSYVGSPLPLWSNDPGTRTDDELQLGLKTFAVFKLPQALPDFRPRGGASFRTEVSDDGAISTESLLHHLKRFGS